MTIHFKAFETDIKCRLIEIKCVLSNLLSVYTMYTDNIPPKTCCQYSVSCVGLLRFHETELTFGTSVPQTCAIYGA